ncbi:MAG: MaoC family dehydratase N-terminal domain-containing protein [Candidatus Competibacteraceae bacterium]|nr:MaoC family dehydratase N-terminal domain-containing protein [Candidatus Competibacteraceae bacterium]MCB1813095.1 MaoC family dehydratase N-terminal domain-containing protein [Candidatus Competibacteraceae bacterium]
MALDYQTLLNFRFPDVEQRYDQQDTLRYALSVGLGSDPTDLHQLQFVYEDNLLALPTMATVLGVGDFWGTNPALGLDWPRLLHGEQSLQLHQSLPVSGQVRGCSRIVDIIDKGEGIGAFFLTETTLIDLSNDTPLATLSATVIARGDGGFGGPGGHLPAPPQIPNRKPDSRCDLPTLTQMALLYRLNGDRNPLHADPAVARSAGFERPILHGLCTFGIAGHALLKTCCAYDPSRLHGMRVRFSAPVYPGETVRTEIWREHEQITFRCWAVERDVLVISHGSAEILL